MNARQENAAINALLINLGRSLLQYVSEASPWTNAESEATRDEVYELAERQSQAVNRITEYLTAQNWPIDFGIYPTEYTDLHFVSLDFLMDQIIPNADELAVEIHETRRLIDDPQASELLSAVETAQQSIADRLRELTAAAKQEKPA